MKILPNTYDERVKLINERIASISSSQMINSNNIYIPSFSDIDMIANENKVYFISDAPVFTYSFINKDCNVESRNIQCNTYKLDSDFIKVINDEYNNNCNVFVFYSIGQNVSLSTIRGAFVPIRKEDLWCYVIENRDKKINDIIN
jgi:hypothetical protein